MSKASAWLARNDQRIQWGFVAFFGALLMYAIADVYRLLPGEPGWRPRALVVMNAGLLLQPTAALLGRRSRPLQIALWFLSAALVFGSVRMTS